MAEQHDETESTSDPEKKESEAPESAETQAEPSELAEPAEDEESDESDEDEPAPVVAPVKKKKKKRALQEEAANQPSRDRNKRLREEAAGIRPKRGTKVPARNLEAGEMVDDALARSSQAAGDWLKKNFAVVQWLIIALVVGWVAYAIYSYRAGKQAAEASNKLSTAIAAENARIGTDESKPDPQTGIVDTRPSYPTEEARLEAAETQYRAIADGSPSTAASFAKLGLASVLYDQGKYADAKTAYQAVKDSKLASQDQGVKGRALEGVGMSQEALGDKDGASKSFGELVNIDALGFNALGAYHQARLAFAAGNTVKAKELLQDAQKRLDAATGDAKKSAGGAQGYLQQSVRDLLRHVDPSAVPAPSNGLTAEQLQELQEQMSGGGEGKGLSQEKLQELLKRMAKTAPAPGTPAPPASAP